jgi:hypothetical protein
MLYQENVEQRLNQEKMFDNPISEDLVCGLFNWKQTSLVTKDKHFINENEINSTEGIERNIKDLKSFNQLIKDREIYYNQSQNKLNDYVIFGKYWLDQFAQVGTIMDDYDVSYEFPVVCTFSEFYNLQKEIRNDNEYVQIAPKKIPKDGECCPWCKRKFVIEDLKKFRFGTIKGATAHLECKKEYEREQRNGENVKGVISIA